MLNKQNPGCNLTSCVDLPTGKRSCWPCRHEDSGPSPIYLSWETDKMAFWFCMSVVWLININGSAWCHQVSESIYQIAHANLWDLTGIKLSTCSKSHFLRPPSFLPITMIQNISISSWKELHNNSKMAETEREKKCETEEENQVSSFPEDPSLFSSAHRKAEYQEKRWSYRSGKEKQTHQLQDCHSSQKWRGVGNPWRWVRDP